MEITNNSKHYAIPLVVRLLSFTCHSTRFLKMVVSCMPQVGRRIAQIVFFDTDGTLRGNWFGACVSM